MAKTAQEVTDAIREFLETEDPSHYGRFERLLEIAVKDAEADDPRQYAYERVETFFREFVDALNYAAAQDLKVEWEIMDSAYRQFNSEKVKVTYMGRVDVFHRMGPDPDAPNAAPENWGGGR